LQARSRQLSHDQAEWYSGMVEISHAIALDKLNLPGGCGDVVARAGQQFEWASHEIAAGLVLTPAAADRELAFGTALCERLPLVCEAMRRGRTIDSTIGSVVGYGNRVAIRVSRRCFSSTCRQVRVSPSLRSAPRMPAIRPSRQYKVVRCRLSSSVVRRASPPRSR
jgi:hypothetical protein